MTKDLKAYKITAPEWMPSLCVIEWEETASKARYSCMLAAKDAGYDPDFSDLKVRRAPEWDHASYMRGDHPLSEDYVLKH